MARMSAKSPKWTTQQQTESAEPSPIPKTPKKPVQQTKEKGQALSRAGQPGPKSSATTPSKRTITMTPSSDSGGSSSCPESNVEQKAESPANHSDQENNHNDSRKPDVSPNGPSAPHHPTLLQPKNNNYSSNRSLFPSCVPPPEVWLKKNPVMDQVLITDVTINDGLTVTVLECQTHRGFFRKREEEEKKNETGNNAAS
ncbi:chromobox 8 [Caerostris extrusa]|uniref:Chromobox 8 n=1 Tax=Caerostris extrusa TaxID=172846 RepID=A0AAV4MP47_CAEEX|nr:chromobox 8 [Caerostris extrusa]